MVDAEDVDRLFEALADERRRYALRLLDDHATLTLADLADEIAVREHDAPIVEIHGEDVKEAYVQLYHCHLPKLREVDLVHYDQDRDLVTLTERGEWVVSELDANGIDAFA